MFTRNFLKKWKSEKRGIILVDGIVAIAIVGIGLAAVIQLYIYGTNYRYMASMRQKAVQIAAERIEKLKGYEADGVTAEALEAIAEQLNTDEPEIVLVENANTDEVFYPHIAIDNQSLEDKTGSSTDKNILIVKATVEYPKDKSKVVTVETYLRAGDLVY